MTTRGLSVPPPISVTGEETGILHHTPETKHVKRGIVLSCVDPAENVSWMLFAGGTELGTQIKLLTPNINYSGRTAPLTSKVAFYIFIQQI